ncbi:Uncharacterized protein ChrSV_0720 [Chromobacterium vaccinii]|nr:Uncharacterized protein ChrSW_0720 [Chromobacterium vaccinii]QND88179.1 Uncharacterized protein ChrSV_0720 [Chromobacterium vaccinii]
MGNRKNGGMAAWPAGQGPAAQTRNVPAVTKNKKNSSLG